MKRVLKVSGLAGVLWALLASAALAEVPLYGAGVLQQYCAEEEDAPHPALRVMRQVMTTDELATFGGTLFTAIYQSETEPDQTGKMAVRIRIKRADGSYEKVGKIVARQRQNGSAESERRFPVAARQGDTVIWRFRFLNFEDLSDEDCVLLIAVTVRP